MRKLEIIRLVVSAFLCLYTASAATASISLAGQWRFSLDPDKSGLGQEFFNKELPGRINLPGTTDEAKLGVPNPGKPTKDELFRPNVYEGMAWYQRDIDIPASWRGKRVTLFLERTHWTTEVWVDGRSAGAKDSLIAPHVYEFPEGIPPGRHRLTICVDNTKKIDLGRFVSINYEGTQTNWNGLIGKLELRAADPVSMADVQVYPDVARKVAKVRIAVVNTTRGEVQGVLTISATARRGVPLPTQKVNFQTEGARTIVEAELAMGADVKPWDEFSPALYDLKVALAAGQFTDERIVTFGMRSIETRGTQFTLNGRALFLRGTLECGIFPLTGYPPMDVEPWRRIYHIMKSYGLNIIRFHSWTPPEAAFTAADEEGMLIQTEGPQANVQTGVDSTRDAFMEQELHRIVRTYGNHPSFVFLTPGNEFGGSMDVLTRWVGMLRDEDPRHLYSSASNNRMVTANRQFTVSGRPRGVQGPGTAADFREAIQAQDRPLVGHEIAQWTFYPDFNEIRKYTGVLTARNFELVRDDLRVKHMLDLAPRFFQATGRHAVLLYKEEMEVIMRTPGHAGFHLLDLHDYPGQGTALIGLLDPFWDSKGFITPEAHRRYAGPTVPLLRLAKRTYCSAETLTAQAEVAHFGPKDLAGVAPRWTIRNGSRKEVAGGLLAVTDIPTGKLTPLGSFELALDKIPAPAKLTVTISFPGTGFANDWEIWVYPAGPAPAAPTGVLVSRKWDEEAKAALRSGGRVVLFPELGESPRTLPGKFLPVFWSPIWFPKQQPNTMGILCDPKHPALAKFPTEFYSNWQWWNLIQSSRTLILDDTPPDFRPIVQVIDNFSRNHKLGNVLETRVGKGKLLVVTIDLPGSADEDPAAAQLMRSLYAYVTSPSFEPRSSLEPSLLDTLLAPW